MRPQSRQSTFDIALQHCGSVEAALQIAMLNGISVTDELDTGVSLGLPYAVDSKVVARYIIDNTTPATAITQAEALQTIADEGIEFWAIEEDFVIS